MLRVSGRITAWRFMPRETGRLYCAVVRESGSGQYTVVGVNEIDMNLHRTGVLSVFRTRLHQASTLQQLCDDATSSVLIEINGNAGC